MLNKRHFLQAIAVLSLSALALPSFADESDPPEGYVTINYWRADGNYGGWGVHAWNRPAGGGKDSPIEGVDWFSPLKPKGKTPDGGAYYQAPLKEFGSTQVVHFIIHKGDNKEQGGKDQEFNGAEHKQVWVNQGDKNQYFTKEDAIKARSDAK